MTTTWIDEADRDTPGKMILLSRKGRAQNDTIAELIIAQYDDLEVAIYLSKLEESGKNRALARLIEEKLKAKNMENPPSTGLANPSAEELFPKTRPELE